MYLYFSFLKLFLFYFFSKKSKSCQERPRHALLKCAIAFFSVFRIYDSSEAAPVVVCAPGQAHTTTQQAHQLLLAAIDTYNECNIMMCSEA